jgi:hypothetical protein
MIPSESIECPECSRVREAYWHAMAESLRRETKLSASRDAAERQSTRPGFEQAELICRAARKAFLRHRAVGHGA